MALERILSNSLLPRLLARKSALKKMTQLSNVLITDNSTIKTNYWWSKHPIIVSFLRQIYGLLISFFRFRYLFMNHEYVQVNLSQKHLFLHQLTHNMTKYCLLIYQFSTWKLKSDRKRKWQSYNLDILQPFPVIFPPTT